MAETTDREASKVRLLAMAADYEARAKVAHELVEPPLGDEIKVLAEPSLGEPLKAKPGKRITMGLKEPVIAQRRPVVRPGAGVMAASYR
jgi:hypothetical protein